MSNIEFEAAKVKYMRKLEFTNTRIKNLKKRIENLQKELKMEKRKKEKVEKSIKTCEEASIHMMKESQDSIEEMDDLK